MHTIEGTVSTVLIDIDQHRKHIDGLDALRTLAIISRTLFHVFPETFPGGYIGVCLFLVITGFLLAYGASRDLRKGTFSVRRYFLKRLKRLYPPLILVILLTAGLYHFLLPRVLEDSGKEIVSILLGFNNWWQLAMNADYFARVANAAPFTHMWFLGVEIEYVVLWPAILGLCVLLARRGVSGFLTLFFLGVLSAGEMVFMSCEGMDAVSRMYYGTDTRAFACLFGGAMGLCFAERAENPFGGRLLSLRYDILFGLLLLPVLAAVLFLDGKDMLLYAGGMQLLSLVFVLMLFVVTDDTQFGALLENPIFQWIGEHSYEIFLWQYPVLYISQRKGWHHLAYGPALEILLIFLGAFLAKGLLDFLTKREMPLADEVSNRFWRVGKRCAISLTLVFVAAVMGFGLHDILAADFNPDHQPGYKLKMELEQKQAELAKAQAEWEAREARAVEELEKAKNARALLAARLRGAGVTMIGDSVMVGASPGIGKIMPEAYVDALSNRDVCGGFETAQKLKQEGKLGDIVVIALGTNGPLLEHEPYASGMQNMLQVLGNDRQIFWITVYCSYSEWMRMNNQYLAELERTRPNFHLIDWYPLAADNPEWLLPDGTHPSMEGVGQYAKLIHDTLEQELRNH